MPSPLDITNVSIKVAGKIRIKKEQTQNQMYGGRLGHIDQFIYFLLNTIIDPHYDTMYTCQVSSIFCLSPKALIMGLIGDSPIHTIYKLKSAA